MESDSRNSEAKIDYLFISFHFFFIYRLDWVEETEHSTVAKCIKICWRFDLLTVLPKPTLEPKFYNSI